MKPLSTALPLLGAAACVVGTAPPAGAQALPEIREIMHHLDDLYRSASSHSIMAMTVVRERGTRELTLESWTRGLDEALIVIREPAREAGTATLRTADGLWNYAPRADRLIRIPSGLLSESWMGSHFTNDDVLRETSYLDDHQAALRWITVDGDRRLEVTMTPHEDAPVVYTRLVFHMQPDTWVPSRADYWDGDDLVRTMEFDRVEVISGRRIPMRMTLLPADDATERTEVLYTTLEFDIPVTDDTFTRRGLRRVAQ